MKFFGYALLTLLTLGGSKAFSQAATPAIKAENEKKFTPYMMFRHGGPDGVSEFKKTNPDLYAKELWYYAESFYVKRDHLAQGAVLDESIIDIGRFENQRQANQETIVLLPGFKDALVLLPTNQLIYKP